MSTGKQVQYSWATGPLALIPTPQFETGEMDRFTKVASEMAVVHNSILRGFNSIYIQAPRVQLREYKNFIGYSLAWYDLLAAHHDGEEDFLFPNIEAQTGETGLMDANVTQHELFQEGLENYASYLRSLKGEESRFSGTFLIGIMDEFKDVLAEHLRDEIFTILNLARYEFQVDLVKLMDEEGKHTMGALNKFAGLPLFFLNHDVTFEDSMHAAFPPAPWVAKIAVKHVFTWWNAGFWKFATCDKYGRPKELYYALEVLTDALTACLHAIRDAA